MSKIVIIGAGGHAREVLDILLACQNNGSDVEPLGFIDEDQDKQGQVIDGFPVLGGFDWFDGVNTEEIKAICAVGTPRVSRKLIEKAQDLELKTANVISPRAQISPKAHIGTGVMIFPDVIINTGVIIGDCVTLNVGVTVSHDTRVGDFCNINPGVHLAGNVFIGEGCYIGMGTCVIQGVKIGIMSTIGAGAVVIQDVPAEVTAVGIPAEVI